MDTHLELKHHQKMMLIAWHEKKLRCVWEHHEKLMAENPSLSGQKTYKSYTPLIYVCPTKNWPSPKFKEFRHRLSENLYINLLVEKHLLVVKVQASSK